MESQVLQSPYFLCFSASVLGIFLVWRNRFGAINSIKMQFEGSVILNNAKSSHRVNADRRHPWRFVILAIVSIPFILFFIPSNWRFMQSPAVVCSPDIRSIYGVPGGSLANWVVNLIGSCWGLSSWICPTFGRKVGSLLV